MSSVAENFDGHDIRAVAGESMPIVAKLVRNAAGLWTFHFRLNGAATLPDGRQVTVNRTVRVRANEQIGRRQAR